MSATFSSVDALSVLSAKYTEAPDMLRAGSQADVDGTVFEPIMSFDDDVLPQKADFAGQLALPPALIETHSITLHDLPDDSADSARHHAEKVLKTLPIIRYHRKVRGGGPAEVVTVLPSQFDLYDGNPGAHRNQHSIQIRPKASSLACGTIDAMSVDALRQCLIRNHFVAMITSAPYNDDATTLAFEWEPMTNIEGTLDDKLVRSGMRALFESKGWRFKAAWKVRVTKKDHKASGLTTEHNPSVVRAIIGASPFEISVANEQCTGTFKCVAKRPPNFILPTYYTTLAIYVGGMFHDPDWWTADATSIAAQCNEAFQNGPSAPPEWGKKPHPLPGRVNNFRLTPDGKFFLCDPEHIDLAYEMTLIPSHSGRFYEFVYHLNGDENNFDKTHLNTSNALKRKHADTTKAMVNAGKNIAAASNSGGREIRALAKRMTAMETNQKEDREYMKAGFTTMASALTTGLERVLAGSAHGSAELEYKKQRNEIKNKLIDFVDVPASSAHPKRDALLARLQEIEHDIAAHANTLPAQPVVELPPQLVQPATIALPTTPAGQVGLSRLSLGDTNGGAEDFLDDDDPMNGSPSSHQAKKRAKAVSAAKAASNKKNPVLTAGLTPGRTLRSGIAERIALP